VRRLRTENALFGIGKLLIAAVVAAFLDEFLGGGENRRRGDSHGYFAPLFTDD